MLQSLVEFRLLTSVCEAWQWSRMRNLRMAGETLYEAVYRPKFTKFWDDASDPLYFLLPCSICLYSVSCFV